MPSPALRPSACPGLLRIVQAADGGICRIKLNGGSISAAQAVAVADAAQRFAGGVIEATNRANLQIRGIRGEHRPLIESLLAAGLGPRSAAGDDVRNLMLSPAAGVDRQMRVDTRPLAARLLATLEGEARLHDLSAKFAVQLDGGEALAMLEHPHDLWLSAFECDGQWRWAFGLAGCPTDHPAAAVPLEHGHALVVAVLELFLELARPEQTRMRHVLAERSLSSLLAALAERVPLHGVEHWQRSPAPSGLHIGCYPQRQDGLVHVGAVPPLGRLKASMLLGAARLSEDYGDASLRLTPWQSLLLPNIAQAEAPALSQRLHDLGFILSTDQALAHVVACTGSAGCAKGLADTKGDGQRLAAWLQVHGGPCQVHLSGCLRSCAAAHTAPVTLLAVSPGHYDVYFRDAGHAGFGALRARNLTIDAVGALLDAHPRSPLDA
nr:MULTISPECIES: precorrin-3B synthase [unclassified Pseudomonas]